MTKIKLCGLTRTEDILTANGLMPEYIGFVFAPKSRRAVTREKAEELRARLAPEILAVGVFTDSPPETVAGMLESGLLDLAQLHGHEDEPYIARLRELTEKPLIRAFRVACRDDAQEAERSSADFILLDAGAGEGRTFAWELAEGIQRPYFLAGGLTPENAVSALERLRPYALDVSSGIETDGRKDPNKMRAFVNA
ncbi:MAG: phosphoribosylanthranilate isomerase, partial [Thermoguttaceae bacterium]|nr:phosphoribosylanthranilate isomerase [Thermoguttaceae bacterium]